MFKRKSIKTLLFCASFFLRSESGLWYIQQWCKTHTLKKWAEGAAVRALQFLLVMTSAEDKPIEEDLYEWLLYL